MVCKTPDVAPNKRVIILAAAVLPASISTPPSLTKPQDAAELSEPVEETPLKQLLLLEHTRKWDSRRLLLCIL